MSREHPVNKAASVRDKLHHLALKNARNFQEIVQYYVMERFLYRLGQSEFRNSFILKGALMLRVWGIPQARATMDIDLLGMLNNHSGYIEQCVRNILQIPVPDDGLVFDPESVTSSDITHDADYRGRRWIWSLPFFRDIPVKARLPRNSTPWSFWEFKIPERRIFMIFISCPATTHSLQL